MITEGIVFVALAMLLAAVTVWGFMSINPYVAVAGIIGEAAWFTIGTETIR